MTNQRKRRGPKPTGKPRARAINFSVSAIHYEWLMRLNDRSKWLADQIDSVINSDTKAKAAPDTQSTVEQNTASEPGT
jgi:hypothetical protein